MRLVVLLAILSGSALGCPPYVMYDYIVVGAGSSGCVVANRLATYGASVLLLESGGDPGALNDIPGLTLNLLRTSFARIIPSQPSPNYCLSNQRRCLGLVMANATGGVSAINGMIYSRGTAADFDEWANDYGALGWAWANVEPIFRSLERYQGPENPVYGTQGNIYFTYLNATFSLADEAFIAAGTDMTKSYDKNLGQVNIGFSRFLATIQGGIRQDAFDAFIRPLQSTARRVEIITGAFVTKVDFLGRRAQGVVFDWDRQKNCRARARREVILSAGSIMTPKILMHSGIGPRSVLQNLGIPVVSDVPVGQNLQNHVGTTALNFSMNEEYVRQNRPFGDLRTEFVNYLFKHKGVFTLPFLTNSFGFINTTGDLTAPPNIGFLLGPTATYNAYTGGTTTGVGDEGFAISVTLTKPFSKGFLVINSTDPYMNPVVNMNYFSDPRDMETLVTGMRFILNLTNHPSMQAIGATITMRPVEGCHNLEQWSDRHLECLARHLTMSNPHYTGTCRMGTNKLNSVVNPRLRVHGVRGLRVIDASVMPSPINGHPMAACHVIGAKGAGMILWDNFFASSEE